MATDHGLTARAVSSTLENGQTGRREPPKVMCVHGREQRPCAKRARCDHAVHQGSPSPSRLVEQTRAQGRVFLQERSALRDYLGGQLQVARLEGTAKKLRPGDHAHTERLASPQPVPEPAILGGPVDEAPDQKTRVEMNQRGSRRLEEECRSRRARFSHRRAAAPSRPRERCSAPRAANALGAPGAGSSPAARIARRKASDLLTPQRRAMSSSARVVSTSRE